MKAMYIAGMATVLAVGAGCSNPFGSGSFMLELMLTDTLVGPDRPMTITVTATNTGDDAVAWGEGSSSCQLGVVVRDGSSERSIDLRACTADLVVHGLGPGRTRTEGWEWTGEVVDQGIVTRLPPGSYQLIPIAGQDARGESRRVRTQ